MSFKIKASIIVTTYNWPEALAVTLKSVLRQSRTPEEIVVADDGSGPETVQVVESILRPSGLRWCHVRHQDSGIRQARIKNLSVKYTSSPYLIFIDHDVLLHPDFLADHLFFSERGIFLQGKRAFLPEYFTKKILANGFSLAPSPFIRGLKNRKNAFRWTSIGRRLSRPKKFQTSLRGCNLSMNRDDFMRVDGYDETFDQLWGREDSDICYRLFHSGTKIRNLWFSALQYHLYHRVIKKREEDRLDEELRRNLREKRQKSLIGLSRLSSEGEIVSASKDS